VALGRVPETKAVKKELSMLGGRVVFSAVLGGIRQGLLVLSDGLPMLGVLHPTAYQASANNWEFNGEPALELQL
jgi:hypothetical protein